MGVPGIELAKIVRDIATPFASSPTRQARPIPGV